VRLVSYEATPKSYENTTSCMSPDPSNRQVSVRSVSFRCSVHPSTPLHTSRDFFYCVSANSAVSLTHTNSRHWPSCNHKHAQTVEHARPSPITRHVYNPIRTIKPAGCYSRIYPESASSLGRFCEPRLLFAG
jgi:hypothetical protein